MYRLPFLMCWVLALGLALGGCGSPDVTEARSSSSDGTSNKATVDAPTGTTSEALAVFVPHKSLRVAVVGAGPSGLTAADTLRSLGYTNVTVFEKNNRVGGKVYSFHNGTQISELGAVFASPDYKLVLGLADKYGIPYTAYTEAQYILNEAGQKQTSQDFLLGKYTTLQVLAATVAYAGVQTLFASAQKNGFAYLPADLQLPMNQFAAKYGITPIAELVRSVMIGFGYGYYETTPAMYYMKLLTWLVKIGGSQGLEAAQYYTFPTGYQSIWEAVAANLNVQLNSEVTSITRRSPFLGSAVQISVNGGAKQDFDVVIVSAPLNKVSSFVSLSSDEASLFSQVTSERYFTSFFLASGLATEEALFFQGNAVPSRINHINVWANRDRTSPLFVGYQIADWSAPLTTVTSTLAQDVASQGGAFGGVALRQEWDYFPHVTQTALANGFYEKVEALQGNHNTFYVGGTLSFETVEHSARYAQELVQKNFPPVLF